mgnify:CR=1 FL=1
MIILQKELSSMNLLIDNLDKIVKMRIKEDFNTNFRNSILFELLMQESNLSNEAKVYQALKIYYPKLNQISDIDRAIDNMLWFYKCGKKDEEETSQKSIKGNVKRIYSYEFDNELIYSAFKDQYGIDLQDVEYLHWWKFKAMFDALKDDNKIVEIMGYRAVNLSKIKDKEMKKHYKKMQKLYALPDMRSEEEKENDFAEAFS